MSGHDKRQRYLGLLDEALCQGNWTDVTELARKVDKHIPERKYFTLVSRAEAQIATVTRRPGTASTTSSNLPDATDLLAELTAVINDSTYTVLDDQYCASICLAGIHWIQHNYEAALQTLPREDARVGDERYIALGWLEVCAAKAAFIRATALERIERSDAADEVYTGAARQIPGTRSAELRRWTERLLAAGCMFKSTTESELTTARLQDQLQIFRAWNDFWQRTPAPANSNTLPNMQRTDNPRRTIWQSFYVLLSTILRRGLIYNTDAGSTQTLLEPTSVSPSEPGYHAARIRQVEELKSVEAMYESLLVNETQFPKANENNLEAEEWVEYAVANWKILHGPHWTSHELGPRGRDGISRDLLEILYRAATKTFHSTAVLRHLFMVHASLGEYDLALHAFSSYEEIAEKGKARAQKTGKREPGFDDDDTIIVTAAEAVRVLCRFGEYDHAQRAVKIGKTVAQWLAPTATGLTSELDGKSQVDELHAPENRDKSKLQPTTMAAAYRAVGISQANWARWTFEADVRSSLQAQAVTNLKLANKFLPNDLETTFALAKTLAETRDLASAIEILKSCISEATAQDEEDDEAVESSRRKSIQLMPLWHLLSFCLTANEDHEPAIKVCNAAFDQFKTTANSMHTLPNRALPSELLSAENALIEQMDNLEKETVIQTKLSQLAFLELTDNADAAVDQAEDLLALYTQLFGPAARKDPSPPVDVAATPTSTLPSRRFGTLRSRAGSTRVKTNGAIHEQDEKDISALPVLEEHVSPHTSVPQATVKDASLPVSQTKTNDSAAPSARSARHHLHLPFRSRGHHSGQTTTANEKASGDTKPPIEATSATRVTTNPPQISSSALPGALDNSFLSDSTGKPQQNLPTIQHNLPRTQLPKPLAHDEKSVEQDVRLPGPGPGPVDTGRTLEFTHVRPHEQQHNITILSRIWLFIAQLYINAGHLDDALDAIEEAARVVAAYETRLYEKLINGRGLALKGWGGGESVDQMQANVAAMRGHLALAQNLPYQAMSHYEQALSYDTDHAAGIIGITDLLMDIYEEKLAAEEPVPLTDASSSMADGLMSGIPQTSAYLPRTHVDKSSFVALITGRQLLGGSKDPSPAELNRLAARDRAYMLLSTLTKLGHGWDNAEAWFRLARSYELSKQVDKARQALWWVVELENHRPIRPWSAVAGGGYTL